MTTPTLPSVIAEALADYARAPSLEAFLHDRIGAAQAGEVLDFIDRVNEREGELQAARAEGTTTAAWLGRTLADAGPLPETTQAFLAGVAPLVKGDSAKATGQRILQGSIASMGMGAERLGGTEQQGTGLLDMVTDPKASALVDTFLQSPIGAPGERAVVAAASAGVLKAADALNIKADPRQVTGTVDLGFRLAKAAFQVQNGELSGLDAALELVEDRVAAQVGAAAGILVEKGGAAAGMAIGAFIETKIPMGGRAVQAGQVLGSMAGKALRPVVEKGVRTFTKKVIRAGRKVLKKAAKATVSALKSKVVSWLGG